MVLYTRNFPRQVMDKDAPIVLPLGLCPRIVFPPKLLASEDHNQYRYTLIRVVTALSLHNPSR